MPWTYILFFSSCFLLLLAGSTSFFKALVQMLPLQRSIFSHSFNRQIVIKQCQALGWAPGWREMMDKMIHYLSLRSISLIGYLANQGRSPGGNYCQDESWGLTRPYPSEGWVACTVQSNIIMNLIACYDSDVPLSRCIVMRPLLSPVSFLVCELLCSKTMA